MSVRYLIKGRRVGAGRPLYSQQSPLMGKRSTVVEGVRDASAKPADS